jgi:hypothetical protein
MKTAFLLGALILVGSLSTAQALSCRTDSFGTTRCDNGQTFRTDSFGTTRDNQAITGELIASGLHAEATAPLAELIALGPPAVIKRRGAASPSSPSADANRHRGEFSPSAC